ncbi:ATP-binding protein [Nocardiopsis oceani]
MTDSENRRTTNTVHGSPEALVQTGAVHGDVHIAAEPSRASPVPRQLPLPARGFVDREALQRRLDTLTVQGAGVPVAVLAGPPGVGKTALAVRWAHHARSRFPDGDLYISMHGHAPGLRAQASQALDTILRTLGVASDRIPLDVDGRSALYRSEVHGKRLLVVIDDVLAPAQVRPLLPASSGSMVVVTSRSTLPGLVARDGAERLHLGVLPLADSVDLLRVAVGARVDSEREAACSLAEHCARLPLALRVAAERLIDRPDTALADLVDELAAEESRLDSLAEEDELSDLRAVMTASYQSLDTEAARFFRRLGLHPGPEFSIAAASALADVSGKEARRLLERLGRANLVERPHVDRYRLHDLVRLYVVERVRVEDGDDTVPEIIGRLAWWYAHAASRAQLADQPHFPVVPGGEPPHELPDFTALQDALSWFETERTNLVAVTEAAQEYGHHDTAWRLPASVYPLFEAHRHWHAWVDLHRVGLRAAEHAEDPFGLARNHLGMGDALWLQEDLEAAEHHYRAALESSDAWVKGFAHRQLSLVSWQRGERGPDVVRRVERSRAIFREVGERRGEAMSLISMADFQADAGRWEEALIHCREAMDIFEEVGAEWSVAWARCSLGRILTGTGHASDAALEYRAAITVFDQYEDADSRAVALLGLGDARAELKEPQRAREAWSAALDYLRDHDDPRTREVEERLRALDS